VKLDLTSGSFGLNFGRVIFFIQSVDIFSIHLSSKGKQLQRINILAEFNSA